MYFYKDYNSKYENQKEIEKILNERPFERSESEIEKQNADLGRELSKFVRDLLGTDEMTSNQIVLVVSTAMDLIELYGAIVRPSSKPLTKIEMLSQIQSKPSPTFKTHQLTTPTSKFLENPITKAFRAKLYFELFRPHEILHEKLVKVWAKEFKYKVDLLINTLSISGYPGENYFDKGRMENDKNSFTRERTDHDRAKYETLRTA